MRYLILLVVLLLASVTAQAQNTAAEKAANLRAQLAEVEAKQAELQTRLKDLDEQIKPENIEHSLAGYGSTRPEDVREQRRKQLEIERNGVQTQLNLLATSHTRLEALIAKADADAYQQSAAPPPATPVTITPTSSTIQSTGESIAPVRPRKVRKKKSRRTRRSHHVENSVARTDTELAN